MSCERGREIHDEFEKAIAVRAEIEAQSRPENGRRPNAGDLKQAKAREATAGRARAFHLHDCAECWQRPPQGQA